MEGQEGQDVDVGLRDDLYTLLGLTGTVLVGLLIGGVLVSVVGWLYWFVYVRI